MTSLGDDRGPRQQLPPGMPRRFAQYVPVDKSLPDRPVVNVGGYDELVEAVNSEGRTLWPNHAG